MLAKNYSYTYEAVLAKRTVFKVRGRKENEVVLCRENVYYPLYNAERIIEDLKCVQMSIKEELEKETEGKCLNWEELMLSIKASWFLKILQVFKNTPPRIILESGYKESFIYNPKGKGVFVFDFQNLVHVSGKKEYPLPFDVTSQSPIDEIIGFISKEMTQLTFDLK